jgi:transglutaminase-like putative cysteine protease
MRTLGGWLICLVLVAGALHAQEPAAPPSLSDYAQEAVVVERLVTRVTFDADGNSVRDHEFRGRVQSAAGVQQVGTLQFSYARETSALDVLHVLVRKPDGSTISTPTESALDLPAEITRAAPTFTDQYVRHVNVVGLAPGDTLEYAVRIRERSLIPGEFWLEDSFGDYGIVLDGRLEVTYPESREPVVRSQAVQSSVSSGRGTKTHTWRYTNLERLSDEAEALRLYERLHRPADVQISTFKDWRQLGETMRDLWREATAVTPTIRAKALELTRNAHTDDERARAIYGFVATGIRYVAVSFGIGRIQPHAAEAVLTSGFGDCKDKHTLLVALLAAVGIEGDAALIGPDLPIDPTVVSLAHFNHVITAIRLGSTTLWVDTTLEVLRS